MKLRKRWEALKSIQSVLALVEIFVTIIALFPAIVNVKIYASIYGLLLGSISVLVTFAFVLISVLASKLYVKYINYLSLCNAQDLRESENT